MHAFKFLLIAVILCFSMVALSACTVGYGMSYSYGTSWRHYDDDYRYHHHRPPPNYKPERPPAVKPKPLPSRPDRPSTRPARRR